MKEATHSVSQTTVETGWYSQSDVLGCEEFQTRLYYAEGRIRTSHERVCAAARKLRCELGLVEEVSPTQAWAVDAVVEVLGEHEGIELDACLELRQVGEFLREVADEACLGPGAARVTMAAAAVYAADRLTEGKTITQQDVADTASAVVSTSKSKVSGYSREVADAYETRYGTRDVIEVMTGRLA